MVKLRLKRIGRKGKPAFRLIAIDANRSRDSKALEELGFYSPQTKEANFNKERVEYWLSVGAQPSERVARMLVAEGIWKKDQLEMKTFAAEPGEKAKERAEKKQEAQKEQQDTKKEEEKQSTSVTEETSAEKENS